MFPITLVDVPSHTRSRLSAQVEDPHDIDDRPEPWLPPTR